MHDGPERRKNPMQVFNIYPQMGPVEHAQLDRLERVVRAVFRQNDQMLELLLENQGESPEEKAAYIAMRETLRAGRLELVKAMEDVNKIP